MSTKANLIKWTISLALLTAATVAGLALATGSNGQSQIQPMEVLAATEAEIIPASLIEQIPAESKLEFWYAREYGNASLAAPKTEIIPASLIEQIPAESKLEFWYAREYSNGTVTP